MKNHQIFLLFILFITHSLLAYAGKQIVVSNTLLGITIDIASLKTDCLSFVACPLLAPAFQG
jgi:hypothetical protein